MITFDLRGRCVLVTGGASGIGLAAATRFAESGATVAINDRPDNPALDAAVSGLTAAGREVLAAPGDAGDPEASGAMVESAANAMGRLDYLVNNAGTAATDAPIAPGDLDALTEDLWESVLGLNLIGPFRCTRAAVPWLRRSRGAVVNTALGGRVRRPGKQHRLRGEQGGPSRSDPAARARPRPRGSGQCGRPPASSAPRGRLASARGGRNARLLEPPSAGAGEPGDVADVMVFLCTGAAYVTGQTVVVDGGMY